MSAKRRIIPVFVPHLGCPNDCVFCNQRRISGAAEPANAETVRNAIVSAGVESGDCTQWELAFYGGSFTAIDDNVRSELLSAAEDFVKRGGTLRLSTRPDCIDENVLSQLKAAGVKTIELGCQSMDSEVLLKSGRGHTAEDSVKAAELVKSFGFALILQMMTGLPGDSFEKSLSTAKKLAALKPDGVRIYPTVIIRDTPLCDLWKCGKYSEHTVDEAAEWCSEIIPVFESANIPVIRLGLNPTDDLSGGDALAGAYHPAFGELVYSRVFLKKARTLLKGVNGVKCVQIGVNTADVSKMSGHKKQNINALKDEFGIKDIRINGISELAKNEVVLIFVEK